MSNRDFLIAARRFVDDNRLLRSDGHYLLALSGGADSVAMLRCMLMLGYKVESAHCNFCLRGEESDRDEVFCRTLCEQLGVPLHVEKFDTRAYSRTNHISIEMAARDLRYAFFRRLADSHGYDGVCVAHNADDNVETVLLNIIRGTGIRGLKGIRPMREGVIRPLLFATRGEIEQFLAGIGQGYVTDSSNLISDVMRNRIRLELLPLMEEINPSVRKAVLRMADDAMQTACLDDEIMMRLWDEQAESVDKATPRRPDEYRIRKQGISNEHVLHFLLQSFKYNSTQVRQLFRSLPKSETARIISPTHQCIKHGDWLYVAPLPDTGEWTGELAGPSGSLTLPDGRMLTAEMIDIRKANGDDIDSNLQQSAAGGRLYCGQIDVGHDPYCVYLDAEKVVFPLMLRKARSGDRLHPYGMDGSMSVSRLLTNTHASPIDRQRQMLLTDARGRICWVVGRRIAHHVRITGATKQVIRLMIAAHGPREQGRKAGSGQANEVDVVGC